MSGNPRARSRGITFAGLLLISLALYPAATAGADLLTYGLLACLVVLAASLVLQD